MEHVYSAKILKLSKLTRSSTGNSLFFFYPQFFEAAEVRNRLRPTSNRFTTSSTTSTTEEPNYELIDGLVAEAQISPTEYEDLLGEGEDPNSWIPSPPPHVCVDDNADFKYKSLCIAFDKDMHELPLHASALSGYTDENGKCRYPLVRK